MNETKACTKCGVEQPYSEFHNHPYSADGFQYNCKSCQRAVSRAYYQKNKERLREEGKQKNAEFRELMAELKSDPCMDCNTSYPPYVMDFDHVRGEKTYRISAMTSFSEKRILEEVAKCDVVCANCHRERTHQRAKLET